MADTISSVPIGFGDFLNCIAGGCTQDIRNADLGSYFSRTYFLVVEGNGLYIHRGDEDGEIVFLAEDFCREVAVGGSPEHRGDDLVHR